MSRATPSQIVDEVKLGIRRIVEGKAILDWQGVEPRQQAERREQASLIQHERNTADTDTRGYIKPSPMLNDKLEDYLSVRRLPGSSGKRTPEKSIRDVRVAVVNAGEKGSHRAGAKGSHSVVGMGEMRRGADRPPFAFSAADFPCWSGSDDLAGVGIDDVRRCG